MHTWVSPDESEQASAQVPAGPVHIGRRVATVPPQVHVYAGLEHISGQIAELQETITGLRQGMDELRQAIAELSRRPADSE